MRRGFVLTGLLILAAGCDRRIGAGDDSAEFLEPAQAVALADGSEASAASAESQRPAVDNSAVNVRDRVGHVPTPFDHGALQSDVDITAAIRTRVVKQAFSINGHNVKIITQQGKVTLRGPVQNEKEKRLIEGIAADVVGPGNVVSMLDVM